MARPPRVISPHHPHHVMHRGNNRGTIFVGPSDYAVSLEALHATVARSVCQLHASVLLTNHIHVLISPTTVQGLPSLLQALGRRYV